MLRLLVLGMHRSGTSATTRVVNLLGVPLSVDDDLAGSCPENAAGLWESLSICVCNQALLLLAGGEWWCPADDLEARFGELLRGPLAEAGRDVFERVHPTPHWVCKDPRTALTMRFWSHALGDPLDVAIVVRDPLDIAASLWKRDGFDLAYSLALWERYLRSALMHSRGRRVCVVRYEELLRSPDVACRPVIELMEERGLAPSAGAPASIAEFLDPQLRHHWRAPWTRPNAGTLSAAQAELFARIEDLAGYHPRFSVPALSPESPSTTALIEARREAFRRRTPTLADSPYPDPMPPPAAAFWRLALQVEAAERETARLGS